MLLLAPSISSLQALLYICESELNSIDTIINASKSNCLRIGPCWNCDVTNVKLTSRNRASIEWFNGCRYLGIFVTSGATFKCKFDAAKAKLYRLFNAINGRARLLRFCFYWCVLNVLQSFLYGIEACPDVLADKKNCFNMKNDSSNNTFCKAVSACSLN